MLKKYRQTTLLALLLVTLPSAAAGTLAQRPEVKSFVAEMEKRHQFNGRLLKQMFNKVNLQPAIIEAITRPAEAKPWSQYRPIFLTPTRITGGVEFWRYHNEALTRAEEKYGVPAEVIIAIIGVETRYGRHMGNYRVLDALATLAFDYAPRSTFFRSELEHYLLMTREEQLDPLEMMGSYAGAMGQPQFISSSFRNFAIDFDGDGSRDLWNSTDDVIGSVANYFSRHGWTRGAAITTPVEVRGDQYLPLLGSGVKPANSIQALRKAGVVVPPQFPNELQASLIGLDGEKGKEYWAGLNNFYVITRYNHSALYAMAVFQLSQAIKQQHLAEQANTAANKSE